MSGFRLAAFVDNMGSALSRKPFKPNNGFKADPVPSANAQVVAQRIPGFKPGAGAPDPVPAGSPESGNYDSFKTPVTYDPEGNLTWMEVNPIPARPGG